MISAFHLAFKNNSVKIDEINLKSAQVKVTIVNC